MHFTLKRVKHEEQMKKQWVEVLKNKGLMLINDEKIQKKSFRCVEDILEFK